MFKKIVIASGMLLVSSNIALADMLIPYVGADLALDLGRWTLKDVTGARTNANAKGAYGDLVAGFGWTGAERFYLGAEVFGAQSSTRTPTKVINTSGGTTGAFARMRWTYGASLLPGYRLTDTAITYLRFSVLKSRFQLYQGSIPAGFSFHYEIANAKGVQVGIGLQNDFSRNWGIRGEYDYVTYRSISLFNNKFRAYDNQIKVGLMYNFC